MNEKFLKNQIKFTKQRVREIYGRKANFEIINIRDYYEGTLGFDENNYIMIVVNVSNDFDKPEYLIERFNPDPRSYGWSAEYKGEEAIRELDAITSYIQHKKDWKAEKFVFGDIEMKLIKQWEKKVAIKV